MSYSCCVRNGIVLMKQCATDTRSETPFTPCLEDFRQTVVDVTVSSNRLSVLKRYGGNLAEFCKETRYHLLGSTSVSFEFPIWEAHTADCCFVSGSYWYTQVLSSITISQTRGDLPPTNFLSTWVCPFTLPRFCSPLRLWGTQRAQRFFTPRQS